MTFSDLVNQIVDYINTIITILIAASLVVFFWGIVVYIFKMGGGSSDYHTKGRQLMMWGIIIFFVMFSVWGLVNLVASTIF